MKKSDLFNKKPKKMLHIAPEFCFSTNLSKMGHVQYITIDLKSPSAMLNMDITSIQFPDNYFDVIYCSHVLQEVLDDYKALKEMRRVCRPEGLAVLQVPIVTEQTIEDPTVLSYLGRMKKFGQGANVRKCGWDYIDRMKSAGFDTQVVKAGDLLSCSECKSMKIDRQRSIFFCTPCFGA
ncbi:MAG: class I SAM-dependent methyltransferase [Thermodesulfobacteriota bacterium]|nr:class I SAM-dependent methyltransferase [Thermodesulfobacteriota bacterium]